MKPTAVHDRMDEVQVIDVREPDEWEAGHIEEADHVPMDEVPQRLDEVDDDQLVVTVCRSGARSGEVAEQLQQHGYEAENLDGGMQAWQEADLPLTAEDDGAPRVA